MFFIACVPFAHARLGETEAELAQRFGKPMSVGKELIAAQGKFIEIGTSCTYQQDDWIIQAVMIDGRCAKILYYKKGEWTEEQYNAVLASNAQGRKWRDTSKPDFKKVMREWRRDDKGLAIWQGPVGMTVTNPIYDQTKAAFEARAKSEAHKTPNL